MKKKHYLGIGIILIVIAILSYGLFFPATGGAIKEPNTIDLNDNPNKVTIYFFWGDGCPHCESQKLYLSEWQQKYPEIEVKMFEVWKNPNNYIIFRQIAQAYGIEVKGVPTTFIGDKSWSGFASSMAPEIEDYIVYCIENSCENPGDKLK